MVSVETVRTLAFSFENVIELPHFEAISFRVNKKIFATVDVKKKLACLMLNEIEQSVFSAHDPTVIYPVPNKWGQKGATYVELTKVKKEVFKDALIVSYCHIAPKKLADKYRRE